MVIVRIQGGLANQMYQYTFFYWLTKKHKEKNDFIDTYCDTSLYYHKVPKQECDPVHNGYELDRVFGIDVPIANLKDVYRLSEYRYNLIRKAFVKAKTKLLGEVPSQIRDGDVQALRDIDLSAVDNKFFTGTWGGFKYANEYESDIREIFSFPKIEGKRNIYISDFINHTNSISIHVRRGDYLTIGTGINLNRQYYDRAVSIIKGRVQNPFFFVFSDDINWCKDNLNYENTVFVDWNTAEESYRDMQLMSMCRHNIVANSTFSMWASWLNQNNNKIVLRPSDNNEVIEGIG